MFYPSHTVLHTPLVPCWQTRGPSRAQGERGHLSSLPAQGAGPGETSLSSRSHHIIPHQALRRLGLNPDICPCAASVDHCSHASTTVVDLSSCPVPTGTHPRSPAEPQSGVGPICSGNPVLAWRPCWTSGCLGRQGQNRWP